MTPTVHSYILSVELLVCTLVDVRQLQIARAMMRCATSTTPTATGVMALTVGQAAHPTPTARWSDLSAALLPPKDLDQDLMEVDLNLAEVNLVAPMIPTDAAAPVTLIVLNWRQRCRTT